MWAGFSSEGQPDLVVLPKGQMMRTAEYCDVLDSTVMPTMIGYELTHLLVGIGELTIFLPVIGHCEPFQCFHWSIHNLSVPYRHHVIRNRSVRTSIGRMGYSLSVVLDLNFSG